MRLTYRYTFSKMNLNANNICNNENNLAYNLSITYSGYWKSNSSLYHSDIKWSQSISLINDSICMSNKYYSNSPCFVMF